MKGLFPLERNEASGKNLGSTKKKDVLLLSPSSVRDIWGFGLVRAFFSGWGEFQLRFVEAEK